jgi:hypothetical protein
MDVLVVPRLVKRRARAARVAFLAARVPTDVVVAGRDVHLRHERPKRLAELCIFIVTAHFTDIARIDDERGRRVERADLLKQRDVRPLIVPRAEVRVGDMDEAGNPPDQLCKSAAGRRGRR